MTLKHCLYLLLLRMLQAPDRCWRVQLDDHDCITFAKTAGAARWNAIRSAEERREYNRIAQQRHRTGKTKPNKPLPGEQAAVRAIESGAPPEVVDDLTTKSLPAALR